MTWITNATLAQLKSESFRNGIRLFCDACTLYKNSAWPTAYACAVLAYEELGKCLVVDRILSDICLNPWGRDDFIGWLRGGLLTDHKRKQLYAAMDSAAGPEDNERHKRIATGDMERQKQMALYVEFRNGRVELPSRITAEKAVGLLQQVLQAMKNIGDLPHNGIDAYSTKASEWKTRVDLQRAEEAFAECESDGRRQAG